MAHPLLQVVRQRYSFRCGYCGVSEEEVGGELTVDHFRPVSAGGGDWVLQEQFAQREPYINYLEERLDKFPGRSELE